MTKIYIGKNLIGGEGTSDSYTKAQIDEFLLQKQNKLIAGENIKITKTNNDGVSLNWQNASSESTTPPVEITTETGLYPFGYGYTYNGDFTFIFQFKTLRNWDLDYSRYVSIDRYYSGGTQAFISLQPDTTTNVSINISGILAGATTPKVNISPVNSVYTVYLTVKSLDSGYLAGKCIVYNEAGDIVAQSTSEQSSSEIITNRLGIVQISQPSNPSISLISDSFRMVQEYEAPLQEVISAVGSSYQLPIASTDTLGGIKVGEGLSIDGDGILSTNGASYELPVATTETLGGVKPDGTTISITEDGTISAEGGSNINIMPKTPLAMQTKFHVNIVDNAFGTDIPADTYSDGGVGTTGGSSWRFTELTINPTDTNRYYILPYDTSNPDAVYQVGNNNTNFWVFANYNNGTLTPKLFVQNSAYGGPVSLQYDSTDTLIKYVAKTVSTQEGRYQFDYIILKATDSDTYQVQGYNPNNSTITTLAVPDLKPSVDNINVVYKYVPHGSTTIDLNNYKLYESLENHTNAIYTPTTGQDLDTVGGDILVLNYGTGLQVVDEKLSLDTSITETIETHTQQLGGISLAKITQTEYDELETKDENTLYIITD